MAAPPPPPPPSRRTPARRRAAEPPPPIQDVSLAVKRLQWRHHREANRRLASVGLSLVQWDVLRHLHEQPLSSLHALAELTYQTDQSMGALAARMVDRNLIERVEGPGRPVHHQVTEAGQTARRAGEVVMTDMLADTLGQLTPSELAALHRLLIKATP